MALLTNTFLATLFPIIAWLGPVIKSAGTVDYAEMRACGFTHTLNIYHNWDDALTDLDRAARNDIGIYVYTPRMFNDTDKAVSVLSQKRGLAGYLLSDEPGPDDLPRLADLAGRINDIDPEHPCYVNLHPYYEEAQMRQVGISNYDGYIRAASSIPLPVISFDYYSVTRHGLRPTWFQNMTSIRNESLRTGRPFWGFILSVPHSIYNRIDAATMRLQAYVNLAYGAQGLVYFTYMTPEAYDVNDFHDAPIGANGKKTANYALVQAMNRELKTVTPLFLGAKVNRIQHIASSFFFAEKLRTKLDNISSVKASSSEGILVSEFTKAGHQYAAFVNKDYTSEATLTLASRNNMPKRITKKLTEEPLQKEYTLPAGDILIIRLN